MSMWVHEEKNISLSEKNWEKHNGSLLYLFNCRSYSFDLGSTTYKYFVKITYFQIIKLNN